MKNRWPWMYGYSVWINGMENCLRTPVKFRAYMSTKRTLYVRMENEDSSKRRLVLFCTRKRVLNTRISPRREYCVDRKSRDADRCRVIATNARFPNSQGRQHKMQIESETFRVNPQDDIRLGITNLPWVCPRPDGWRRARIIILSGLPV